MPSRVTQAEAPKEPDRRALLEYSILVITLTWLTMIARSPLVKAVRETFSEVACEPSLWVSEIPPARG